MSLQSIVPALLKTGDCLMASRACFLTVSRLGIPVWPEMASASRFTRDSTFLNHFYLLLPASPLFFLYLNLA